jgi:hypothetical protein
LSAEYFDLRSKMMLLRSVLTREVVGGAAALLLSSLVAAAEVESPAKTHDVPPRGSATAEASGQAATSKVSSEGVARPVDEVAGGQAPVKSADERAGVPKPESGAEKEVPRDAFRALDKELAGRVEARWRALIDGNFTAAYDYTLPSYRQTHTAQQYRSRFGNAVRWRVATVQGIRYDNPIVAHVRLSLETEHVPSWGGQAERLVTRLYETWLYRDGEWWLSVGA